MRAIEIDLFPREETRGDEMGQFDDVLEGFLSALTRNGNLCGDHIVLELGDKVQVRAIAPADDALELATWSLDAHEECKRLEGFSPSAMQMRIVPEAAPDEMDCDCVHSSSLILFSSHRSLGMPVRCLGCDSFVPLYRLPHLNDEKDHWTLRAWHRDYETLEDLYMNSGWGERMAYRLLSNPRASFIKHSREVAAKLEAVTQKPVYVFLLNVYEKRDDACPRCGRVWLWPESTNSLYAFKCDHCRLISQHPVSDLDWMSQMHP